MRLFSYEKASLIMENAGVAIILASSRHNVGYLADYYRGIGDEYDVLWDATATHKTLVGLPKDETIEAFLILGGHEKTGVEIADPWITDRRYWGPGYYIKNWTRSDPEPGNPMDIAAEALIEREFDNGCIAVNMRFMGVGHFNRLQTLLPKAKFIDTEPLLWELRKIKTIEEIRRVREACKRTSTAWKKVMEQRYIGMTEKDMQRLFFSAFNDEGLIDPRIYVMFGPTPGCKLKNGSPMPSNNVLKEGMFSRVDIHGIYNGYTSDLSRALAFGKASKEMEKAQALVRSMVERLHSVIKPGLSYSKLRAMELDMYAESDYPPQIPYTGHNIGRAVHEPPFINEREETILESGMIISVEPTILFSANDGDIFVAIEDTVLITENGCESLTGDATWDLYL